MYPNNISIDDIELIDHHLKGIVLRLKFEEKANNKGATTTPLQNNSLSGE